MANGLSDLLKTADSVPHWSSGHWTALHAWIQIGSDLAIWGACMTIPIVLLWFMRRRRDPRSTWMVWLSAGFILACGTTYLLDATMFWWPAHHISTLAKVVTALAAWGTAWATIYAAPRLLALPELARINDDLRKQNHDRKRAEDLLRQSQEHLQLMLEATDVGTWYFDLRAHEAHWSAHLEALHGFAPGTFNGTWDAFLDAVHPDDRSHVQRTFSQALKNGADFRFEYRLRSGADTWMEAKAHVVHDENGRAVRIAGICTSINARKQADQRFRLAVEASSSAVVLVDESGRIILANSRVRNLFGYEPDELIGQPIEVLVPERFRAGHPANREKFHRDPQTRPMGAGRDLYGLHKDGSEVPVEIGLSPIHTNDGMMVLANIVDITSRKHAEQERAQLLEAERAARSEAERANRLKDLFLANVSHELRTPLNAILGWSQLLNRTSLDGEAAQAVQIIQRNARVQAKLIEDLLDMSRIISGKIRLDMQTVELPLVVNSAIDAVMPAAQVKEIAIKREIDPQIGSVYGDANRLQQVVWNLLTNAIKFTPKGGAVEIIARRQGSHARISVSDNGIGIKPEFVPYLFDRFRQGDASTTRSQQGLGLGLSIVKHLVELHGGSVQAESIGEGRGATFTVSIPISPLARRPDPPSEQESLSPPPQPIAFGEGIGPSALNGVKVLVVDDDADACVLAQRVLEDCGASVTTASSAAEALDVVEPFHPDIIISDISMPEQDGYQFIQEVRAREAGKGTVTPAAALTAFTRPEDRARAMLAGYQAHIPKPLTAVELIAVVASLTGRVPEPTAPDAAITTGSTSRASFERSSPVRPSGHILVVEDNRDVAQLLVEFLESSGYRVSMARTMASALDQLERHSFDLLLSDIGLPDGSGIDLMRAARIRRKVRGIALTGHESSTVLKSCREAGFSECLIKPTDEEQLLAAVARTIQASSPKG